MKASLGAALLAFCLPAAVLASQAQENRSDQTREGQRGRRLVGQYEITSAAKDGIEVPEERLNNTVTITADTIAVVDREKKELYSAAYKLTRGGERGTWQIDMESKVPQPGSKAVGLLKRSGEELWLIYDLKGRRPENFDKTIEGQHLFKMKRKGDAPAAAAAAAEGETGK